MLAPRSRLSAPWEIDLVPLPLMLVDCAVALVAVMGPAMSCELLLDLLSLLNGPNPIRHLRATMMRPRNAKKVRPARITPASGVRPPSPLTSWPLPKSMALALDAEEEAA